MTAVIDKVQPGLQLPKSTETRSSESEISTTRFRDELGEQLRFSGHAEKRLKSRGIEIDEGSIERLDAAVEQADERGSNEALVLMDGVAFVVSVPNRTVITAHKGPGNRVYTNIDSTIVVGSENKG